MKQKSKILLYQILILFGFLIIWEILVSGSRTSQFLYSSPLQILNILIKDISNFSLIYHSFITFYETIVGFIIGNLLGISIGLGLWYSKAAFKIAKPYIIILGSIPIFAIAPLLIIWFGTGILSKIVLVILSTLILAMVQSYKGASEIDNNRVNMMKSFGANKNQIFTMLVIPSSLSWVLSAVKLNIGFALLGAFIGEFISSEAGLGHYIIRASGLYDIASVFAGIIMIALIALLLNFCVDILERKLTPWLKE
ncbi:ABC transporter permease [Candidatus Woesearchaeota archaeon]|nr:ABC transporter permease [Candidatus Woesearchaeota archaeon]